MEQQTSRGFSTVDIDLSKQYGMVTMVEGENMLCQP